MGKHIDELSKSDIDRVLNAAEIHYKKGSVVAGIVVRLISMLEATNERAKKAELELIKPLSIGELVHRLEGQTYGKWLSESDVKELRERAEAAEARFDDLTKAAGWTAERCEQTGDSPFDAVEGLFADRVRAEQRAAAAEARLLVPVKLPTDEIGEAASFVSDAEVIPVSIVIELIKAAGYPVEGGE